MFCHNNIAQAPLELVLNYFKLPNNVISIDNRNLDSYVMFSFHEALKKPLITPHKIVKVNLYDELSISMTNLVNLWSFIIIP